MIWQISLCKFIKERVFMAHLPKGQGVFLPPFKAWLASNIPAVYDNTMTYYEELCALIKYLQDVVIPALNHNAEAVTAIATAVEQLQKYVEDYFKNLDVQEEINNKLDEMADEGTLQEIIGAYLNATAVWGFDTVADMKESTNLIDGSYARTLGYSSKNDGGGALYKIRTITNDDVVDESFIIEMGDGSNNLIAEYINTGDIYIEQLGALGLADATDKIQDIIDYSIANHLTIKFGNNHFNISRIQFKTAQLIFEDTQFDVIASSDDVAIDIYNPYKGCEYSNFTVNGIGKTGVKIDEAKNLLVHHIKVNNCKLGIDCVGKYEVTISDSLIKNDSDMVDSVGLEVTRSDAVFRNIIIQGFRTGVKTNADIDGSYFENIHIWATDHDTIRNSIGFDLYYGADLINCYLDTCRIGVNVRNGIRGLRMNNCRWFWNITHYTDEILDGLNTYLIYFADSTCSRECVLKECFGYRPSTITTAYFSNLALDEWESWCNVAFENPSMFNFDNTPKGRITTLTSDSETFTDVTNQVTSTTSGVEIDYVGSIKADATTGMKTIGILGSKDRPQVLPLNTYCVYTAGEWDKPDGMAYCYINANGKIEVRVTSEMIGKYVKLHIVCSR